MIIIKIIRDAALLLMVFFLIDAHAQESKKISILPFEVYSKEDSTAIKESLYKKMSEELKKEKLVQLIPADSFLKSKVIVDEGRAISAGKSLHADFVVMGSLTQLGETLSVDAKIIDVSTGNILSPVSIQGKGLANLASIATQLKNEILVQTGLIEKIAKIEIKGNRKIEASAIIQQIKSKQGNPFFEAYIADDIKTIFKMGFFQDVSAEAISTPQGKVITFTVLEKGLITDIQIKGNKAFSKDDIQEVMTIKARQSLNQEKIKADIEKIKILYDSKGYFNAEIIDSVEKDGEKDFRVILDIKENDRIYVQTITFEGNEAYSSKELKNMMSITEYDILHFFSDSGLLKRDQLKQDINKLATFYFNTGFINSQIAEPQITYDKKGIYIKIQIKEGKRFIVGKVEISGDLLNRPRAELTALLKIKQDKNYDREAIMKDIELLTQACNDEGYAYADVNPKIDTKEKEQLVDIDYKINKGGLVYINRISLAGNTVTRDKVIRRQLEVVEGDLYSSSKLKNSYNNLNRLRYFEEVDFQTEKSPDTNKMNVNVRVKEKNTGMFSIGGGYSATDGATLMGQVVQQNFLGYGQILSLRASLGSTINNYELSFTEPWLFELPLWFKADIWKYKKEYDSYTLDTRGTGFSLGYPLWERVSGYIGYVFSINNIQDVNHLTASQEIIDQEGERTTSSVTLSLARDTTDDNMFPTKGTRTSIAVQYAGPPLGGNVKFIKYSAAASAYYPLFWDMVFVSKGRIGFLQNTDDDPSRLPIYERYVLGGIGTMRGFRYLGPTNPGSSDVIGGTTMLVFNFELVFPLIKDAGMKGVVFYDAGNTWEYGYYLYDLRQSVGAGIRWYSPIGPLRLEYAYVTNRKGLSDDSIGRWEFTIGMFM